MAVADWMVRPAVRVLVSRRVVRGISVYVGFRVLVVMLRWRVLAVGLEAEKTQISEKLTE